ncbi:hypothetical protein [Hymenobacter chitinivorans]|uniref:Uncharacterized protein n=1 Tax=Hymenobacter chitinivorans DSM 11115 TaxID=1121954 RepID=A0A2M9AQR4_9BACT|nr:hypothetical protein [Hymenobacter chitinivorans]PJJ48046.1 hypothetical protein CLV45_4739 [Hymenobacter chitinivorans DSM 11115]
MGLDIGVSTDKDEELYADEADDYFNEHSLSRTFCHFMGRRNVVEHETELDQIGRITGVDIAPLYDMESYPSEEFLEFQLGVAESEEERATIIAEAEADKERLTGNIYTVKQMLLHLIEKLETIPSLPALLRPTDFDSLDNEVYFSDFKVDKGEGYIGNNFGQDLRNFSRHLNYAQSKGATTVWFNYG